MLNTLFKRKSVRTYNKETVSEEELKIVLKAADASPVGMKQYETLHLTIVTNNELIEKVNQEAMKNFHRVGMKPLYDAPIFILISSKLPPLPGPGGENVMYSNAAIMAHNMSLAATALNIGSCYIWGAVRAINSKEELLKEFNLPEGYVPCCAVILGKTNEVFEDKEIPDRIAKSYIK